jgi:F5/8 type C domain
MAPGTNIRDTDTTVDYSGSHLYDWLVTFDEPMGFTWNPYAGTSPPDRARATQSSTLPGYAAAGAMSAVDGNTDGAFFDGSVTATNLDSNARWQVDLGSSMAIGSIVIWNRTDCCGTRLNDYWVFVSDTPFSATDTPATLLGRVGTFSSHQTTALNPSANIITTGAQGRYVRVQLTNPNYLSLAAVQVFGTGGAQAPTNLAQGKAASQSSTLPGYPTAGATSAVDGNQDGNFFDGSVTATNLDPNPWWQVDLGASAAVSSIVIWNRTDCCSIRLNDYWVFVSDTPFLPTDTPATLQFRAGTFSSHQASAPNPSATVAAGVQGRYVRVQLSNANYLSLRSLGKISWTFSPKHFKLNVWLRSPHWRRNTASWALT